MCWRWWKGTAMEIQNQNPKSDAKLTWGTYPNPPCRKEGRKNKKEEKKKPGTGWKWTQGPDPKCSCPKKTQIEKILAAAWMCFKLMSSCCQKDQQYISFFLRYTLHLLHKKQIYPAIMKHHLIRELYFKCNLPLLWAGIEWTREDLYIRHLLALAWQDSQHTHLEYVFLLLSRHLSFRQCHHSWVWRLLHCTERKHLLWVQCNQNSFLVKIHPSVDCDRCFEIKTQTVRQTGF